MLPFRSGDWHGRIRAEGNWQSLLRDVDAWLAANPGELVVSYLSRDVRRISTPEGVVYLKVIRALTDAWFRKHELWSGFKWVCRPSRAIAACRISEALLQAGFACAKPILAVRRRIRCYPTDLFLTQEVPFPTLWEAPGEDKGAFLAFLARESARFHQAGFAHGDFILRNLCRDTAQDCLVTLDNDRTWRPPMLLRRYFQTRNLAQVAYSICKRFQTLDAAADFLEEYAKLQGWPSRDSQKALLQKVEARWENSRRREAQKLSAQGGSR